MSPEPKERDGAAVRLPPPIAFLLCVVLGIVIHAFVLPWPLAMPRGALRIAIGVLVGLAGVVCVGLAFTHFKRTGQNPKPWKSTPEIIAEGIYRHTRNPMYLGLALIQVGLGVGLGNLWVVTAVAVSLVTVYLTAVRPEEAYLEEKFGQGYLDYKARVRRWL